MRKVFLIETGPATAEDIAAAVAAGASETIVGIPPALAREGIETFGYHEIADPEAPVPKPISRMQGRRQLKAEGLLAAVEGMIGALPADSDMRMTYEDASHWHRDHEFMAQMAFALGKDEAAVDAFFAAAALIS